MVKPFTFANAIQDSNHFNFKPLINKRYPLFIIPVVFTLLLLRAGTVFAQLSCGGVPPGFTLNDKPEALASVTVRQPDVNKLLDEDKTYPSPYRFATILPVDISTDNAGNWIDLPNGSRLWRVLVKANGAKALSAYFDRFHLPEGGKLFIYNPEHTQVLGNITHLRKATSLQYSYTIMHHSECRPCRDWDH